MFLRNFSPVSFYAVFINVAVVTVLFLRFEETPWKETTSSAAFGAALRRLPLPITAEAFTLSSTVDRRRQKLYRPRRRQQQQRVERSSSSPVATPSTEKMGLLQSRSTLDSESDEESSDLDDDGGNNYYFRDTIMRMLRQEEGAATASVSPNNRKFCHRALHLYGTSSPIRKVLPKSNKHDFDKFVDFLIESIL